MDIDPDCTTVFLGNLPVGDGLTEADIRMGLCGAGGISPNDIVAVRVVLYFVK